MMRSTYYMWGIERNKDPDLDEKERNTSTIVLLEDRSMGEAGISRFTITPRQEIIKNLQRDFWNQVLKLWRNMRG